ncbi:MAG: acyltransferase [Acidobacteriota bacterium]
MSANECLLPHPARGFSLEDREMAAVHFRHFPALDGLRGIAVLAVMACHLEFLMPALHPIVQGGFLGVDIFFVLSGFLITSILLSEQDATGTIDLKNFFTRRFLRLGPALWFFLICLYLGGNILLPADEAKIIFENDNFFYTVFYLMNWHRAYGSGSTGDLNHTWSLAIEEQFYIIWSLALYTAFSGTLARKKIAILTAGFIAILILWRVVRAVSVADLDVIYYSTDTRIDGLLIGCLASLIYCWRLFPVEIFASAGFRAAAIVSPILALAIYFEFSHHDLLLYVGTLSVFSATIAVIILWLVTRQKSVAHTFLENRFLTWTGRISYSLYLWHHCMYEFSRTLFNSEILQAVMGVIFAVVASCVSYILIERPIVKIKDQFTVKTSSSVRTATS